MAFFDEYQIKPIFEIKKNFRKESYNSSLKNELKSALLKKTNQKLPSVIKEKLITDINHQGIQRVVEQPQRSKEQQEHQKIKYRDNYSSKTEQNKFQAYDINSGNGLTKDSEEYEIQEEKYKIQRKIQEQIDAQMEAIKNRT
ncbi:unnamed protein product [Paramecium sonneborni]|uniref:Uncharacterized protein n=1 Tax=Paramecium sonneborni TaxID=65129 RepID=A0A8S1RVQ8_9CILI|nr:unnamed protein product [Paramecium sonneborni]